MMRSLILILAAGLAGCASCCLHAASTATCISVPDSEWKPVDTIYFSQDPFYYLVQTSSYCGVNVWNQGMKIETAYQRWQKIYKKIEWIHKISETSYEYIEGEVKWVEKKSLPIELVGFSDGSMAWRKKP